MAKLFFLINILFITSGWSNQSVKGLVQKRGVSIEIKLKDGTLFKNVYIETFNEEGEQYIKFSRSYGYMLIHVGQVKSFTVKKNDKPFIKKWDKVEDPDELSQYYSTIEDEEDFNLNCHVDGVIEYDIKHLSELKRLKFLNLQGVKAKNIKNVKTLLKLKSLIYLHVDKDFPKKLLEILKKQNPQLFIRVAKR